MLKLRKEMYGLKKAAKEWHLKLVLVLESLGFRQAMADPCLSTMDKGKMAELFIGLCG